jgi:hypothetical protein
VTELMNSGGDLGGVLLGQQRLDLAHGHAARVHGDDLVVKAREAALMLGDQQRLEAALAVARDFDAQRAVLGQYGIAGIAVAVVGYVGRFLCPRHVAQVVAEFPAQRSLNERLLQRRRRVLNRLGRHRPLHNLVQKFVRNLGQRRRPLGDRSVLQLRLARHTCRPCRHGMPHTQNFGQAQRQANASAVGTLVERTSRLLMLIKLPHPRPASAANVLQAFTDKLLCIAVPMRQSMTYDQGREMARHKELAQATGIAVYFVGPEIFISY